MIYIDKPALSKSNLYNTVLQTIEDICDQYSLQKEFGVISTANQQVVEFLQEKGDDFTVDFSCFIDNDEVGFCFESTVPVFQGIESVEKGKLLAILSDNLEYQTDFKQVSFSFRAKTHLSIQRDLTKMEEVRQRQL